MTDKTIEQQPLAPEIDLMRDVYMSRAQREAYGRILARALEQPAKQPLERCPECYRPKARDANDCAAGCCAKWYAVRDGEASAECEKLAAFWKQPEGREVVAWEIRSDSGAVVEITSSIKRRDELLYRGSTNNLPEWKSRPLVYGDTTPPAKVPEGQTDMADEMDQIAASCEVYSPDQCATLIDGIGWIAMRYKLRKAAEMLRTIAQPASEVEVSWHNKAAEWLESKAAEQEANNLRWPDHAAVYPSWREKPVILQTLAMELLAAAQQPKEGV